MSCPSVSDFVSGSCDEVPPHKDSLRKRWTSDQQDASAVLARQAGFRTHGAQVVEHPLLKPLTIQSAVAAYHQNRVFVRRVQRQHHFVSGMDLHIHPEKCGIVRRGRRCPFKLAGENAYDAGRSREKP